MAAPPAATKEKGDPAKNESEIEALRKELEEIKRQLAEQDAERARSQNKSATLKVTTLCVSQPALRVRPANSTASAISRMDFRKSMLCR